MAFDAKAYYRRYRRLHPEETKKAQRKHRKTLRYKRSRGKWRRKNRLKINAQAKAWRGRNPEKSRKYTLKWRAKRRAHWLKKLKEWRSKNKKRLYRYWRSRREANPERFKLEFRKWAKRNPARAKDRNAQRRKYMGKDSDREGVVACWERIITRAVCRCVYCGDRVPKSKLVMDHWMPLSKGGLHVPGNIRPSCAWCNFSKGNKLPGVWKSLKHSK